MSTATKEKPAATAPETKTAFERYQVRYGTYWAGDEFDPETGRQTKAPTAYGPSRKAGDIVESTQDLTKLNDKRHPNGPRFVKLGDGTNLAEAKLSTELLAERQKTTKLSAALRKSIEGKTVRELIDYAESEEIDVKGETRKDPLVKLILDHLGLS